MAASISSRPKGVQPPFPIREYPASGSTKRARPRGPSGLLDPEALGLPGEAELLRRRHVTDEGGCRDHGGAREIPLAPEAHAVLPVAVERRDRPLPLLQGVRALTEAGTA